MDVFRSNCGWRLLLALFLSQFATQLMAQELPADADQAALFAKWKTAISEPTQLEISCERIEYNHVFDTETYSRLLIQYDAGKALQLGILPYEVGNSRPHRTDPRKGIPYTVKSGEHSVWFWTTRELYFGKPGTGKLIAAPRSAESDTRSRIDVAEIPDPPAHPEEPIPELEKQFKSFGEWYLRLATGFAWKYPEAHSTSPSRETLFPARKWFPWAAFLPEYTLPSLFAADTPTFLDDFDWKITYRDDGTVLLEGKSLDQKYSNDFRSIAVILDPVTGRPQAQKTVDPSENVETVILFKKWRPLTTSLNWDAEERRWDYEAYPLPPEYRILSHRNRK